MGTRERILDAAAAVIKDRGLASATTKEIAREVGLSEAMLYKHFTSKHELFIRVLMERLPPLAAVMRELPDRVGTRTVRENLEHVADAAIDFYTAGFPMTVSMFSEAPLLASFKAWATEHGSGPHVPVVALAGYLAAEQETGRVARHADPQAAAALLMGACFQRALLVQFTTDDATPPGQALVATLCTAILPAATPD